MLKKYKIRQGEMHNSELDWKRVQEILSFYLPYIKKNILIENSFKCEDCIEFSGNKNQLCIHSWILPQKIWNGIEYKPNKFASIFGLDIKQINRNEGFSPSEDNGPVLYSPEGMPVAQIIKQKDIYILYNWCQEDKPAAYRVLEEIIKFYIAIGNPDFCADYEANKNKKARERLANAYATVIAEKVANLRRDLKNYERDVIEASEKLIRTMRERDAKRIQLNKYNKDDACKIVGAKIEAELEKLEMLDFALKVEFNICDQVIAIFCKRLILADEDGQKYDIGRLKMNLGLGGVISVENLDRTINDCQHPHITERTSFCIGPIYEAVIKHLAVFNVVIAAELLWKQLNKYSSANPYTEIENWPEVTS